MKIEPMTIEDFLTIMAANRGIWPQYDQMPEEQKRFLAHVNICTGTAESYFDDEGNLFGMGGIRYTGIGEAWFLTVPERRRPVLFRTVARNFERIRDDKNLFRIFAESKISEHFLQELGFEKQQGMHIWTRK